MAVRLAKLLDIDPLEIVAVANYNRAVRTENAVGRRLWQRLFKLVANSNCRVSDGLARNGKD